MSASHRSQVGEHRRVAGELAGRRERVQVGEAGQADRFHLGRAVELHRARAERDHAAIEGVVAIGQRAQVAQHRGLGVMRVEDRVGQERRRPSQRGRRSRSASARAAASSIDVGAVERRHRTPARSPRCDRAAVVSSHDDRHRVGIDPPEVDPGRAAPRRRTSSARPGTRTVMVSKIGPSSTSRPPARSPAAKRQRAIDARRSRSRAARPGRDRRRTCWRRPPAAPARCRCCSSPCRDECAARGSARPADRPGAPSASTDTPTSRPGS